MNNLFNISSIQAWSYIAGFYEGEGSCGFYFNKSCGRPNLTVTICQKSRIILDKINKFIHSGTVYYGNAATSYRLCLSSAQARWFLNKILLYCHCPIKIKQLKKALKLDKKYIKPRRTGF